MALRRFTVERYRCFVEATTIELRPLTLLFGRNAAGKSALARVLPLLAASSKIEEGGPLALKSDEARDARYADIRSRFSDRNALGFSIEWDHDSDAFRRLDLQLREMPEQNRHIIEHLRADLGGHELELRYEPTQHTKDIYRVRWKKTSATLPLQFAGIRPRMEPHIPKKLQPPLSLMGAGLSALSRAVHWLTAVRASIPRRRPFESGARLGPRGESVDHILAGDWQRDRSLSKCINPSYGAMFQQEIRIDETSEGVAVVLEPIEGAPIATALTDTGEGVSQALPVFVLGALAETGRLDPGPLLVLEQPEMHLHPDAERELAKFLCRLAKKTDARLLIETHSENLLLFVELAVARGDLTPDDIAIYFVRPSQGGGGSVADRIEINELGQPKNWPPGVFSEDVELSRELFLTQRRRASAS